jgi:AraC-like DNA-binding protein
MSHLGMKRDIVIKAHMHLPKAIEMIFVDYGSISLKLGSKSFVLNPGECILFSSGVKHSFTGVEGAPFDYMNIMFRGNLPSSVFNRIYPVNKKCFELMSQMKLESSLEQPYRSEIIASFLTIFLGFLIRQAEGTVPENMPESVNYKRYQSEIVNRALKIIAEEYSKPLNMRMLCKSVGVGESRLRQLIRRETGENFSTLLNKQRVTVAKHLLNDGTLSLAEISNALGYNYPAFFFRIFKRITGLTPGAYAISLGEPTEKI